MEQPKAARADASGWRAWLQPQTLLVVAGLLISGGQYKARIDSIEAGLVEVRAELRAVREHAERTYARGDVVIVQLGAIERSLDTLATGRRR